MNKIVGTAGVWRIQAVNDAGGWKDRTTVEDMDLAVRASLKGWKFVFVGDLSVSFFGHPLISQFVAIYWSSSVNQETIFFSI